MLILITGCAGFIGSSTVDQLLKRGFKVIGVDNFNDYYDPRIKEHNLKSAKKSKNFKLYRADILNFRELRNIFEKDHPDKVIHFAARAGVRASILNPLLYSEVNTLGTVNMLNLSRDFGIKKFIFGSSSSVYGLSSNLPFSETDHCENIISPYGASKRSAEFFVESFWRTWGLKSTILRLFTVYGPRGRPDMAPALFTKAIMKNEPINKYGAGTMSRDYTYIDDVVDGIIRASEYECEFEIFNLGNNHPIKLNKFIETLEDLLKKKAEIKKMPIQPGDVEKTWANVVKAKVLLGWEPRTGLELGLRNYFEWLKKRR